MTDQTWATVYALFDSAREMREDERSRFLTAECADPEIRGEVLALLELSMSFAVDPPGTSPRVSEAEHQPGQQFGRYCIRARIGQGGFGRIYAARDRELRREVALKVLSGAFAGDRERLIEEARAASALNHPNIVTVYETIVFEGQWAIVMELVEGQSLRQLLGGALPVERVAHYGSQIGQALAAAHAVGITHRDIKPENILVRTDGYVKLVDFGLATEVGGPAGVAGGTLRYMSPEQLRGEAASPASDVFSFGAVLYEMVSGEHPFPGETPLEAAGAIARGELQAPSQRMRNVPAELDRLIVGMLSREAQERPSAKRVAETLTGLTARVKPRLTPWWRGAAAMVLLALGTGVYWMRSSRAVPISQALRLETRPLTGNGGWETNPALSPDGRFVVYNHQENSNGQKTTWLRELGTDHTTVLPIPGPFRWLPDSRRIGFLRVGEPTDRIFIWSPDGKEEPVLQARAILDFEWSPDGDSLIYAARPDALGTDVLFLHSRRSGQSRQITFPPAGSRGDEQLAISADGTHLAFRRTLNFGNSELFVTSLPAVGTPQRIDHQTAGNSLAWLQDGSAIVSSSFRGSNYSLWQIPLRSPGTMTRLTEIGMEALSIRAARTRNRLAWVNSLDDTNIWKVPAAGGAATRVVSSAMRDVDVATSSLDLIAFRSDRSGFPEIWIAGKDGQKQTRATGLESYTGSPRWSPDGRRLAFDSRDRDQAADLFLMDCDPIAITCGAPQRMTHHAADDVLPSWSPDGSHLYFASQRSGKWQVWKVAVSDKNAEAKPMTTQGGYFATESRDGKWLYYSRIDSPAVMGIWRKRLREDGQALGGPEDVGERVAPLRYRATATWVLTDAEIFYVEPEESGASSGIWALDLKTGAKRMVEAAGATPLGRGLAVSPGSAFLYFVRLDRSESNVMVADYDVVGGLKK